MTFWLLVALIVLLATRRQWSGPGHGRAMAVVAELQRELEAQREYTAALEGRVAELEERLDFTERLLAQSREPDRLQR